MGNPRRSILIQLIRLIDSRFDIHVPSRCGGHKSSSSRMMSTRVCLVITGNTSFRVFLLCVSYPLRATRGERHGDTAGISGDTVGDPRGSPPVSAHPVVGRASVGAWASCPLHHRTRVRTARCGCRVTRTPSSHDGARPGHLPHAQHARDGHLEAPASKLSRRQGPIASRHLLLNVGGRGQHCTCTCHPSWNGRWQPRGRPTG